ncbi:MAG: FadR family transcriptional regulator [Clostridia bacterium]|nr:FadR family transcriptional regulator [Clostridia bacterium]
MQKENLSQRTAETLKKMIVEEHKYKYGEKLPNENELSQELGISRTTLREAIRTLISVGILVVKRGKGTYVSEEIDQYAQEIDVNDFTNKQITLRDLYETRLIFEPEAAALACKRATDEEIEEILRLGEICQAELKNDPRGAKRIESESAFHGAILKASHNEFLGHFFPILSNTIQKTIELNYNLETIAEEAYKDHIMIMNFLKNRDSVGVKSAVTIHLHHAVINEQISFD